MGGSLTFVALASLAAISSIGVGGNIPVDSAIFLGLLILCLFNHVRGYKRLYRFHTRFSPVSTHVHVHLVDFRTVVRLSRMCLVVLINPFK